VQSNFFFHSATTTNIQNLYFWTPPNKVKHLLVAISFSFTIELKIDQLIIANANSTLGQNYLLLPGKNQQFDDKHPDTFTLQKKHLFDHQRTYLTQRSFCRI